MSGRFVDQIEVPGVGAHQDPFVAHLERYPEETLLRVRKRGRTILLEKLTPSQAQLACSSAKGLRLVVLTRLSNARPPLDESAPNSELLGSGLAVASGECAD